MGEEDAIKMMNYTKTVKCKSQTGELLSMTTQEFFMRIKSNEESWKYICETSEFKKKF